MSQREKTRYDALSASSDDIHSASSNDLYSASSDDTVFVFDRHYQEIDSWQPGDGPALFCGWTNNYIKQLADALEGLNYDRLG